MGWLGHIGALPVRSWAVLAPRWVQDRRFSLESAILGTILAPRWSKTKIKTRLESSGREVAGANQARLAAEACPPGG